CAKGRWVHRRGHPRRRRPQDDTELAERGRRGEGCRGRTRAGARRGAPRRRQIVTDVVTLQLPRERDYFGVAHLVLGGLGARRDLTYDVLEDMTTAIDELLNRRESSDDVTLKIKVDDDAIVATVGPVSGRAADGGGTSCTGPPPASASAACSRRSSTRSTSASATASSGSS